ncbi:hypothetical protein ACVGVM_09910 [Pseudonocardia bannensis]|uniref:Uncharacterized protein n=1 Tax=Pseudonocardia bannensis TaxID=630973 RepID=A0A848DSG9_9PSEU|nr:hypothetical protein [Pseudonocardia bannensis]NMH95356.1 hypothetical protein [Pseudonocardia bannensis]
MNNDALVAALGVDAVAAVNGYRLHVISEAERRGLRLVSEVLSDVVQVSAEVRIVDPIDIRLTFLHCPGCPELAGRTLRWGPAHGWSLSHRTANAPLSYYAGPGATPLLLVPTAPEVVRWATGECDGPAAPPVGAELDDDPEAIHRLLSFIDPQRGLQAAEALLPTARASSHGVHTHLHRSSAASVTTDRRVNDASRDVDAGIRQARRSE